MNKTYKYRCIFLLMLFPIMSYSQIENKDSSRSDIAAYVKLDSVIIKASESGLNVDSFIVLIQEDRSFYKAFKNLRRYPYLQTARINFYDKQASIDASASYVSRHKNIGNGCFKIHTIQSQESEQYRTADGEPEYYTSDLLERVFLPDEKHCDNQTDSLELKEKNRSRMEKYVTELKKLMFMTGSESDIPFIGDKTAIFSAENRKYYNYSLSADTVRHIPVYSFAVEVKPAYENSGKVVIQSLETHFKQLNKEVVGRRYTLTYNTLAYEFKVEMVIALKHKKGVYYPAVIKYNGNWDLPFKKRERSTIEVLISNFKTYEKN